MNVVIKEMVRVRDDNGTVAWFNCEVDGWLINSCHIFRTLEGFLKVAGPKARKRNGGFHKAVAVPADVWAAIANAALREYSGAAPVIDDGLRDDVIRMVG